MALTAILYGYGVGGWWGVLLIPAALGISTPPTAACAAASRARRIGFNERGAVGPHVVA